MLYVYFSLPVQDKCQHPLPNRLGQFHIPVFEQYDRHDRGADPLWEGAAQPGSNPQAHRLAILPGPSCAHRSMEDGTDVPTALQLPGAPPGAIALQNI